MVARALVVTNDGAAALAVTVGLRAAGCAVLAAVGGRRATRVPAASVDLVVLDLEAPSAGAILTQVTTSHVPIVLLAGRDVAACTRPGLEVDGSASTVLAKPVTVPELIACVRAILVRTQAADPSELSRGAVRMNMRTRHLTVNDHAVELSGREFALAKQLLEHAGRPLPRSVLLKTVWGMDFDPGTNVVDVCVASLRKKLGGRFIETVRGVGYRWR